MTAQCEDTPAIVGLQAEALLTRSDIGSATWWQHIVSLGVPLLEQTANQKTVVTFFWRDPNGDEHTSDYRRVYIDVNSITNHHQLYPQSLDRFTGTDVWYWQVTLPSHWRGNYAFIPVTETDMPPAYSGTPQAQQQQQRTWLRSIMHLTTADPLSTHKLGYISDGSALHLPNAPDQSDWQTLDKQTLEPQKFESSHAFDTFHWTSQRLNNTRNIWMYRTGQPTSEPLPLVLLLDGQRWANEYPICSALDSATTDNRLQPALYVLIDSVNGELRSKEMACNQAFWLSIQDELIPQVSAKHAVTTLPEQTLIAGQSFGGLAAMYAALTWPNRFGAVISQSGSFWWPYVDTLHALPGETVTRQTGNQGYIGQSLLRGEYPDSHLQIFMEVGSREDVMIDFNQSLSDALHSAGHDVFFQEFEGGHDNLCWRGGLLEGLMHLLKKTDQP